jgi:hypothetical protein
LYFKTGEQLNENNSNVWLMFPISSILQMKEFRHSPLATIARTTRASGEPVRYRNSSPSFERTSNVFNNNY